MPRKHQLDEHDVVRIVRSTFHQERDLSLEFRDDAAILPASSTPLVVSTDSVYEGVHVPPGADPSVFAARLVGRCVSDIAAMGGVPLYASMNLTLSSQVNLSWVRQFYKHLEYYLKNYNIHLVGGDTVCTMATCVCMSMTLIGNVSERFLSRKNGYEGERLYVSGFIGDACLGYKIYTQNLNCPSKTDRNYLLQSYLKPKPHIELGKALTQITLCGMDISDGLILDAARLGSCSQLLSLINLDLIPISPGAQSILESLPTKERRGLLMEMVTWGDDYQLLFSAPVSQQFELAELAQQIKIPLTNIGHFTGLETTKETRKLEDYIRIFDKKGEPVLFKNMGYLHAA